MSFSKRVFLLSTILLCGFHHEAWGMNGEINEKNDEEPTSSVFVKQLPQETLTNFKNLINKNIKTLDQEFNKAPVRPGAQPGSKSYERTLIALSSLLMEKTECAAVMLRDNVLWVGRNSGNEKPIKNIISLLSKLIQSNVSLKREGLIKNKTVQEILSEVSSARASKSQQPNTIVRTANQMIHWLKKIISLRTYINKNNNNGAIAKALINQKIIYIEPKGPHAEMCILDGLEEGGALNEGGFIAISKKCCRYCAAALQAVNKVHKVKKLAFIPYEANGSHHNVYRIWELPDFIKKEKNILAKFLGEEAYKIFEQHPYHMDKFFSVIKNPKKETISQETKQPATTTDSSEQLKVENDRNAPTIKKNNISVNISLKKKKK